MLASKTHFKLSPKEKRISRDLFYLLVRDSEVAGMLFEAPTLISFSVLLLIFFFFLSVMFMSFTIPIQFLHFASIQGDV